MEKGTQDRGAARRCAGASSFKLRRSSGAHGDLRRLLRRSHAPARFAFSVALPLIPRNNMLLSIFAQRTLATLQEACEQRERCGWDGKDVRHLTVVLDMKLRHCNECGRYVRPRVSRCYTYTSSQDWMRRLRSARGGEAANTAICTKHLVLHRYMYTLRHPTRHTTLLSPSQTQRSRHAFSPHSTQMQESESG